MNELVLIIANGDFSAFYVNGENLGDRSRPIDAPGYPVNWYEIIVKYRNFETVKQLFLTRKGLENYRNGSAQLPDKLSDFLEGELTEKDPDRIREIFAKKYYR